ncbi:MAG TPA: 50S ribosomal protein L35 [Candidatus Binataceae bacterium]
MPKIKTNRAAAKRFHFTKTGKVKHKKAYLRHLNTAKSRDRKRRLGAPGLLNKANSETIHALMPYA